MNQELRMIDKCMEKTRRLVRYLEEDCNVGPRNLGGRTLPAYLRLRKAQLQKAKTILQDLQQIRSQIDCAKRF